MHTCNPTHEGGRDKLAGACWPLSLAKRMSSRVNEMPCLKTEGRGAGDMAQQLRALAAFPEG